MDGTVRPGGAAPPSGRPAKGKPAAAAPAAVDEAPAQPYVSFDDIRAGNAPQDVIQAREMWELNQMADDRGRRMSVSEIGSEYQMSDSAVRKRIAAEKRRQELEARATAAG